MILLSKYNVNKFVCIVCRTWVTPICVGAVEIYFSTHAHYVNACVYTIRMYVVKKGVTADFQPVQYN